MTVYSAFKLNFQLSCRSNATEIALLYNWAANGENNCSYRKISLVTFHPADHKVTAGHLPRIRGESQSNPSCGLRLHGERNAFSVPIDGPEKIHLLFCVQDSMMSVLRDQICGNGTVECCEAQKKGQRNNHLYRCTVTLALFCSSEANVYALCHDCSIDCL